MSILQRLLAAIACLACPAVALADDVVDDFGGSDLDPAWEVFTEASPEGIDVQDWTFAHLGGELVVTDIVPESTSSHVRLGVCSVVLSRPFYADGEFEASLAIRWGGPADVSTMQEIDIQVVSRGVPVAKMGYSDAWVVERARTRSVLEGEIKRGPKNAHPYQGSAEVGIERTADGQMRVLWDGEVFDSRRLSDPIDAIQVVFSFYPFQGVEGTASFGELAAAELEAHSTTGVPFRRGDANADGRRNISDPVALLRTLFLGASMPCHEAGDFNDDSAIDLADAISMLSYLFLGTDPGAPIDDICRTDADGDSNSCVAFPPCVTARPEAR